MGLEVFRKIISGKESTRGTAVTGKTILHGGFQASPEVTWHRPTDERGSLAEFKRAVATAHQCTARFQGDALYDELQIWLSMCLKGGISPTTPTNGSLTRLWTFTPSLTSANTQDAFTFEFGDPDQNWKMPFGVCRGLEFGLSMGEVVSLSADIIGQFPAKMSGFSVASVSAENDDIREVRMDSAKIYINSTWGTLGNTGFLSSLAGGSISLNSGLTPVRYASGLSSGLANWSTVIEQRRHSTMDLDLIVSDAMITQAYDALVAGTDRAIRIQFTESDNSIETVSGGYAHELTINMFGRFDGPITLLDTRDGENMFRVSLVTHEDDSGNEMSVTLRNDIPALE